jgi:hypothetical protein
MKRNLTISINCLLVFCTCCFLLFTTTVCNYKTAGSTEISDTAVLRTAILKSIHTPFLKADTLILSPAPVPPGKETPDYIDTKFEQPPYIDSLSKKLGFTIINKSDFISQMISAPENGHLHCSYSENTVNACMQHKVIASIWAEKAAPTGNILVYERYLLGDSLKSFVKEFYTAADGNWSFKINEFTVSTSQGGN